MTWALVAAAALFAFGWAWYLFLASIVILGLQRPTRHTESRKHRADRLRASREFLAQIDADYRQIERRFGKPGEKSKAVH